MELNKNCLSENNDLNYKDIFSDYTKNLIEVSRRLKENYKTFKQLLQEATPNAPPDRAAVDQINSSSL